MDGLLRIGEFAKLAHVSIKTLRFYDAEGLLRPHFVDATNGYRYYQLDQAERLAVITNLRSAGFSIVEIAELLAADLNGQRLHELISAKRERLLDDRRKLDAQLKIVNTLVRSLEKDLEQPLSTVKLTDVAEQQVFRSAAVVPSLGAPVTRLFEAAEAAVAAAGARAMEPPFLIFNDPPSTVSDLDIEVCIPVTEPAAARLETAVIEGHRIACSVLYAGEYSKTVPMFERMTHWLGSVGLSVAGPMREVYHRFGADQKGYRLPAAVLAKNQREFRTELLMPITLEQDALQA